MVLRRLLLTLVVGAATGVLSAVIIAIVDLYLSGHGYGGLTREYFTWSPGGVHLSIGDMIMLATVLLAGALTWSFFGRGA
jgi:hypothetical protein